ncbi:SusC/RagA family TonB-linked outer membrane protein [Marinifilum fragile]|uniref:SusC/RagA family TonB-linked outer membrane protein n=1 Tax=Marinifilum fragile TaxID=570161 RepID=UPI002AA8A478|nr:SusC/RagA family TonB-linked outer membrane protein [Marinifilum fragile]
MKLTLMFLLVGVLQLSASVHAQNGKLNVQVENMQLSELLWQLQEESGVVFIYQTDDVKNVKDISVDMSAASITNILDEILKDTDLDYIVDDEVVVIKKKEIVPLPAFEVKEQEKKTIKGKVTDKDGIPLPGVSVVIKGSNIGVATDINGEYSLVIDGGEETLIFSFVGMEPQEIKYKGQSQLDVVLFEDTATLNEVVITGYQTISKERATGSFNIISKQQIEKPVTNIGSSLVGNVSGVQATLDEEGNPTFEIRGKSSLFANANPLIVVDGFAIEGDFSSINPNDVESITVLKDAAAASIWGARSANGVIVIATKSGKSLKKGDLKVSINSFIKYSPKPDLDYFLDRASSADMIEYEKSAFGKRWMGGQISDRELSIMSSGQTLGRNALNEYRLGYLTEADKDALLSKYASQNNQDQIKDHLMKNPFTHQHNLNIASASERFTNSLSLMFEENQTYLKGNDRQKIMVNYRTSAKVFDWMDFNFNGMYSHKSSSNDASLSEIKKLAPYDMLFDANGKRSSVVNTIYQPNLDRYWPMDKFPYPDLSYNPITEMENRDYKSKQTHSRFQLDLVLKPIDGLKINTQAQYEGFNNSNKNIQGEETYATRYQIDYYTYWDRDNDSFTMNIPKGDILDQNRSEIQSFTLRNQINFDKEFGKHAVNVIAGMEINKRVTKNFQEPRVYGYNDDQLTVGNLPNGYGSYTNPNLYIYGWTGYRTTIYTNDLHEFKHLTDKYVSAYFNGAYTYNDKYTLSASARTDASNLITDDPDYRFSPFWSVGAGWQINKEGFMKKLNWIDRLSLRATFGYNGNVDRSTSFLPLISMYPTNNQYTDEPYASISSYGNPTLRWEKTGTLDIGIDYSLFKGKVFGKLDYYHKKSEDLIASVSIPKVNGVSSQKMNVANMVNKGIELEVGTKFPIQTNKISFYGNFNIAYNLNKITKLYKSNFTHSDLLPWNSYSGPLQTTYVEGKNAHTIYGSKYAGLHNDGTESNPNMQPKIVGKDGTLYGFSTWPADNVLNYAYEQGTTVAPWVAGLSFGFKIHDFDISCIMTGKFGHVFRRTSYNYNATIPNSKLSEVLNADPDKTLPLPQNDNESRYYFWDRFWKSFSYLTEKADHVRMQEINLTYNVPSKLLKKTGLERVKVYTQVNNVFSIYANKFNEDPEFPLGTYRPSPVYTFGINVGF